MLSRPFLPKIPSIFWLVLFAMFAVALSGCDKRGQAVGQLSMAAACYEIGAALEEAAPFRKQMDPESVAKVNLIVDRFRPRCKGDKPPSVVEVATADMTGDVAAITAIVARFKK